MANCKWCGKKLVYHCDTTYQDTDEWMPPSHCLQCGDDYSSKKTKRDEWEQDVPDVEGCSSRVGSVYFTHKPCGMSYCGRKKRKVISRKKPDKPGRYQDGYFCGLTCGYHYAVHMLQHVLKEKNEDK